MTEQIKECEKKIHSIIRKCEYEKQEKNLDLKTYKMNIKEKLINLPLDNEQLKVLVKTDGINSIVKYYCAYSLDDKDKLEVLDLFLETEKLNLARDLSDRYKLKILDQFNSKNKVDLAKTLSGKNIVKIIGDFSESDRFELAKILSDKNKIKVLNLFSKENRFKIALQLGDKYIEDVLDRFNEKEKVQLMSQIYNKKIRDKLDVDNVIISSLENFSRIEKISLIYTLSQEKMEDAIKYVNGIQDKFNIACKLSDDAKLRVAEMFDNKRKVVLLGRIKNKKMRKKYKIDDLIVDSMGDLNEFNKLLMVETLDEKSILKVLDYFDGERKKNIIKNLSEKTRMSIFDKIDEEFKLEFVIEFSDNNKYKLLDKFNMEDQVLLISRMKDEEIINKSIEEYNLGNDKIVELLYGNKNYDNYENKNNKIGLPNDMTFGVELEIIGPEKMVNILKHDAYYHAPKKIILDYAVEPDSSTNNGLEIVSPILKDDEKDLKGLNYMCDLLANMGFETDYSCGGHIHIGADFMENNYIAYENLFTIWTECEEIIYKMSNKAGEEPRYFVDKYAKPYNELFQKYYIDGEIKILDNDKLKKTINMLKRNSIEERKKGLNIVNIGKENKNTIEFRISNGTIEKEELINNIRFFGNMVNVSKKMAMDENYKKDEFKNLKKRNVTEREKVEKFLDLLFDNENEKQIYRKRWDLVKDKDIFNILFSKNEIKRFKRGDYTMREEEQR